MFEISGFDTAGVVSLKRLSLTAALKKAKELIADGCWGVQVIGPGGPGLHLVRGASRVAARLRLSLGHHSESIRPIARRALWSLL